MPPDRTNPSHLHRFSCYDCKVRDSASTKRPNHLAELVDTPASSEYTSAALPGLLLPVDADALHASINAGVRRRILEGASALRAVLLSVIHSSAFSPKERVEIVESAYEQLEDGYGLSWEVFQSVLSEPIFDLGPVLRTPLEHEILKWDPIWEGCLDTSGGISDGIEMIYFLIANWVPTSGTKTSPAEDESNSSSKIPRQQLIEAIRNGCLARPNRSTEEEAVTDRLFQRLIRYTAGRDRRQENNDLGNGDTSVTLNPSIRYADYSASVAYETSRRVSLPDKGKSSATRNLVEKSHLDTSQANSLGFTALIVLQFFRTALSEAKKETQKATTTGRASTSQSSGRREPRASHPVGSSLRGAIQADHVARNSPSCGPEHKSDGSLLNKATMLCTEFCSAGRIWSLSVGRQALRLDIISSSALSGLSRESIRMQDMDLISAEVRLIFPSKPHPSHEDQGQPPESEFVITFPDFRVPSLSPQAEMHTHRDSLDHSESILTQNQAQSISLSGGNASLGETRKIPKKRQQLQASVYLDCQSHFSGIRGFDDTALENEGGSLMLELRVRIRRAMSDAAPSQVHQNPKPISPSSPAVGPRDTSAGLKHRENESESSYSWESLSLPPSSKNTFSEDFDLESESDCRASSTDHSYVFISSTSAGSYRPTSR